jgi:DNA-binding beta-propeller fold protein YncE
VPLFECANVSIICVGSVTTIGGGTSRGYQDGAGAQSLFFMPEGCAVDPNDGTVYVSDSGNNRIRKIVVYVNTSSCSMYRYADHNTDPEQLLFLFFLFFF